MDDNRDYGADARWDLLPFPETYYPTRLEYLTGKILDGMLAGRPLKDHKNIVGYAIDLAEYAEKLLDERSQKKD